MKLVLSFALLAAGIRAQTALIPTAQLCVSPQIGSYAVTGKVGTLSLIKFTCIDAPTGGTTNVIQVGLILIDALTENDALTPVPDGVNKVFTLPNTPIPGTIRIFKNGTFLNPVNFSDFTLSGKTLTFTIAPLPNDSYMLFYVLPRQANIPLP